MVTPRLHSSYRQSGRGAELVQLVGLLVLGVGVGVELAYRASVGFVAITLGSVIFALGTKLTRR